MNVHSTYPTKHRFAGWASTEKDTRCTGTWRDKNNEVFRLGRWWYVFDIETKSKVLYDLDGSKLLCPTSRRVMGYLEYTEAANLKALAVKVAPDTV